MTTPRRNFLKGTGLAAGLIPLALATKATAQVTPPASPSTVSEVFEFGGWEHLRGEFNFDFGWLNFAGFLLATRPRMVDEAIEYHRYQLQRNPAVYLLEGYAHEAMARQRAGEYFGVEPNQVALTNSTTMGLATLYNNISIKPGQEVLSTEHEHYSCMTSLKYRSEREGFRVNTIRLYDKPQDASVDEMLTRLQRNITAKTRVLALTWVHSGSSVKLPVVEVGKLVRELNQNRADADRLLFCVDGVHGFGVETTNFNDMDCDYFVAGTHKWMFGPSGTGIMVSRDTQLENISPTIPPFNFGGVNDFGSMMTPGGFHCFEHQWALPKAFEFHLLLGKDRVQARIHSLNTYLKEGLDDISGVQRVTPLSSELSAGFTFFKMPGHSANKLQTVLGEHKIIASAANRDAGPVLRMAPGLLNSEAEIDTALDVIRNLV